MSNMHNAPFRVALAQVAPVFLDRTATLERACELMVVIDSTSYDKSGYSVEYPPGKELSTEYIPCRK